MSNSFFITGTDTNVGKTRISVALIELLQQKGLRVAGMKPVASGCELTEHGLRNDDALKLSQQASFKLPYNLINPYAFKPAIAPHIAAQQVHVEIDIAGIKKNYQHIEQQSDAVIVEGAGGWLVPLNDTQTMADLVVALNLPVILVVGIKLGCINHALLTVKSIESTGLKLHGWIANSIENNEQEKEIIHTLRQFISVPLLGSIPRIKEGESAVSYLNLVPENR